MANFLYWKDSVLNHTEKFSEYTKSLYNAHKKNNEEDFIFHSNISLSISDFQENQFKKNVNFFNFSPHSNNSVSIPPIYKLSSEYLNNVIDLSALSEINEHYIRLKSLLNLDPMIATINKQNPNNLIGVHTDTNRQLMVRAIEDFEIEKIRKYILFLTPWYEGQVFLFGRSAYTNWNVGDLIEFKWYIPHATANASNYDRYIMTIFGVHQDS